MKNTIIPVILFIISVLLSVSFVPAIFISLAIGILLYVKSRIHKNKYGEKNVFLARSSISLMLAPIITFAFVVAGMSGLFSIFSGE